MLETNEPFTGSIAVADGLVSRKMLRGNRFVRVFPDVYVRSDIPLTIDIRSRAAHMFIGETAVLSGYSAAYFLGADCVPFGADAEVTTLRHVRPQPGLAIHRAHLAEDEITLCKGLAVTTPVRTAYDLTRRLSLVDAVATADSLARAAGFTVADLRTMMVRHRGSRWKLRLPACLELMNPAAESLMESRLRVDMVIRGVPAPVCQFPVYGRDAGFIARLDMAYPWAKVGVEYDGAHHRDAGTQAHDLRRLNALAALGWTVLRYSAADLYQRPDQIAAEVSAALRAARLAA